MIALALGGGRLAVAQAGPMDSTLTLGASRLAVRIWQGGRSAVVLAPVDDAPDFWDRWAPLVARRLAVTVVAVRSLTGGPGAPRTAALEPAIRALRLPAPVVVVGAGRGADEVLLLALRAPALVAGLVLLDPVTAEVRAALAEPGGPVIPVARHLPLHVVSAPGNWGARRDQVVAAQAALARRSGAGRAWVAETAGARVADDAPELALAALRDLVRPSGP